MPTHTANSGNVVEIYTGMLDSLIEDGVHPNHLCRLAYGTGKSEIDGKLLGQSPERCVEERVVWPLLRELNFSFRTEVYCPTENSYFDLCLKTGVGDLLGEVKKFGYIEQARWDIVGSLGKGIADSSVGLVTDGIRWRVFNFDLETKILKPDDIARFDFKSFINRYIHSNTEYDPRSLGWGMKRDIEQVNLEIEAANFISEFSRETLSKRLESLL